MKLYSNKYWAIVVIGVVVNIFIFMHLSKSLAKYLYEDLKISQNLDGQ